VRTAAAPARIVVLLAALLLPAALACRGAGAEPLRWVDWAGETHRQVVVDREPGQYLGHPTTVLLSDQRSILTVYPKGHGAGPIVMKRSEDGGLTWSGRLPTPASWATSMETPTVFPVDLADGRRRLIMFSGLYPVRMARSEDEGATWTGLEPIGHFGGVVAMSSVERLRSLDGELMALFHDDGRFFRRPTSRYERIPGFEPEYGHFTPGEEPWVAAVRFTAAELDEASSAAPINVPAKPVLRVGTSGDYPPFSTVEGAAGASEAAIRSGFDIEVAARLASDLGFDLEFRPFDWPDLAASIAADDFDLAMSGVTWRPARAAVGWMSRAVAAGGPCVVSAANSPELPRRVAVNRGGILERWTRERFGGGSEVTAVDDNLSLPGRLERDEVDAFITDSFEVEHFGRDGWRRRCEPPLDRKVFWVAPEGADELGPAVDRWIQRNERWLEARREEWFGRGQHRDELDHLLDLTARRLAFMPPIAWWKSARGVPIEDLERERVVLEAAERNAARFGLDPQAVRDWFALQIDLAKAVQRRTPAAAPTLELEAMRPALIRLGERQVRSLRALAAGAVDEPDSADFGVLAPYLSRAEVDRVRVGLTRVLAGLSSTPR